MNARGAILFALLAGPLASGAEEMLTLTGETYTNVVVLRYDNKGYFIRHDGGDVKIPYKAVLPELREYYKKLASYLSPEQKGLDEQEEPPGPDDLATRTGRIYRDVVVKKVDAYAVYFSHDGGVGKAYFSEIPDKAMREKYRTATPVAPDLPPGTNDLVTNDGYVFRQVEILRVEPDGLTFRHDGGVTKLHFATLPEAVRTQYGYDPKAAAKYQRELADEKKRQKEEEAVRRALNKFEPQDDPGVAEPIFISEIKTHALPNGEYRVSFAVKNVTDQLLIIRAIPFDAKAKALMGGKRFKVRPRAEGVPLEVVVPLVPPHELRIYCGEFQTNRLLRW